MPVSKNRKIRLRRRIIKLFLDGGYELMSTVDIQQGLSQQLTTYKRGGAKPYKWQPVMNELTNVLRKYPEFQKANETSSARTINGGQYDVAMWRLTDRAGEIM
tara:strand:+ start:548 stop:856 length:309 start_codon:yes stop_codon:yes gene_type:complete